MQKQSFCFVMAAIVSDFILVACGSATGKTTPTATALDVGAISTAAVQTVIAQLTQQAPILPPTAVFTDTPVFTATFKLPHPTLAVPTIASCANALFLSDVTIPDGTRLPVAYAFTKTWRVQNTGSCAWTTSFKLVFSNGDAMGGQTVHLANSVATGQKVDISVNLTVPNESGTLTGYWVLEDDEGQSFGPVLTVVINVGTLSPTPTGSTTVTPTQTLTPKPTKTPTETPTPKPTKMPTEIPTPKPTKTSKPTKTTKPTKATSPG